MVGSAGGIFTIGAAPALGLAGIGAGGGRELIGAAGTGGGGGGVLGIGAAAAGAGEGGGGAAAAGAGAAGAGAAASFLGGATPAAPTLILRRTVPGDTVDPSSTNNSAITPDTDDGTWENSLYIKKVIAVCLYVRSKLRNPLTDLPELLTEELSRRTRMFSAWLRSQASIIYLPSLYIEMFAWSKQNFEMLN